MIVLYLPIFLQGGAIAVDEFYYHHRRGLGRWERLGHPLDTITVCAGYAFLAFAHVNEDNLVIYAVIAVFSSLFVTKDEWVHAEVCVPGEQWLHAVLFLLHPTAFFASGLLWWYAVGANFFLYQTGVLVCFAAYQYLYWSRRAQTN